MRNQVCLLSQRVSGSATPKRIVGEKIVGAGLPSPNKASEDLIKAFATLHQNNLNLPLIFPNAVGDPVFSFAKLEVVRAQTLERGME